MQRLSGGKGEPGQRLFAAAPGRSLLAAARAVHICTVSGQSHVGRTNPTLGSEKRRRKESIVRPS